MITNKLGFIGYGNMGSALLRGILESGAIEPSNVYVYDIDISKLENLKAKYPTINVCQEHDELATNSTHILLAVKPNMYEDVIAEIMNEVDEDDVIISIAAGISISTIQKWFRRGIKVVRAMPNTPAFVREGMTAISFSDNVREADREFAQELFSSVGRIEVISESIMNAIPAISGSAPAYVFMMIEAMGDQGVRDGLPRYQAYAMAAQTILGAAKMYLETEYHPGTLKDMVTSPSGTTIEAVKVLENHGFRSAIIEAMEACTKKSEELTKKFEI